MSFNVRCFIRSFLFTTMSFGMCDLLFSQVPIIEIPKAFTFENVLTPNVHETASNQILTEYSNRQSTTVYNPSMTMIERVNVPPPNSSSAVQRQYADEDIRRYEMEQKKKEAIITEANSILDGFHIEYELPFNDSPQKQQYAHSFAEISKMLNGEIPLDLGRAVFLSESAYDPTIVFADFDAQLNKAASIIGLKMEQDKISSLDNLGKVMTTFKFIADTITVSTKLETKITTYPKAYDFEDFWGRQDYKKMFVSKLLKEGSGQCHSLPLLFLILCEKIGADASLAFAPNHSYVKFQDKRGKWHNFELTNGMLASDHFIVESGYIKAEAMRSGIYMEPLTKKQAIVQCLNDLALGYQRKYGYDPFVKLCSSTALSYDPKSLTARQTLANYYISLSNYLAFQYKSKGLNKQQFDQDERAKHIIVETEKIVKSIEDLGYADIPAEAYEAWLKSIQNEVQRQQHKNEVKVLGGMIEIKK